MKKPKWTKTETTYALVVGQTLAHMRRLREVPQTTIAKDLDVQQSVISRVETGVLPLTVDMLARWSASFLTEPHEVLRSAEAAVAKLDTLGVRVVFNRRPKRGDIGAAAVGALLAMGGSV
jgi:transcriptional regulator with XRE-family HTH domain